MRRWLAARTVRTLYIEPGAPWQNAYVESFNGRLRDEFLSGEVFDHPEEFEVLAARWRAEYNSVRRHGALGYQSPEEFAADWPQASDATLQRAEARADLKGLTPIAGGS